MLIIPALDLKNKKSVRLYKGQFDKVTNFGNDPVEIAKNLEKNGAKWLHIIDLDAAQKGFPINLDVVRQIQTKTNLKIELGGGIRKLETINKLMRLKIDKIILGTIVIENPEIIKQVDNKKIIISIDVKNGQVMAKGWQEKSIYNVFDLINIFLKLGNKKFIYTDIEKDGTLQSPNFSEISTIRQAFPKINLTIAGGISTVADVKKLKQLKINKIIIGKALYTNIKLKKYVSQKNYSLP